MPKRDMAPNSDRTFFSSLAVRVTALLTAAVILFGAAGPAHAVGLIRDAETEQLLRTYSNPIFETAGLNPSSVRIHIVNDSSLNAFVAGGQRMFIHTGLIQKAERPNMLIGVIAHETGHMAGGHLSRMHQALERASAPMIISAILGIGAIVAGAGDAGMAIIAGGQSIGQRNFLEYSRVQESSADQAAFTYLESLGWSAMGMVDTFYIFRSQLVRREQDVDQYLVSHPLPTQRLGALESRAQNSPFAEVEDPPEWVRAHKMVQAKLHGFLDDPAQTFRRFPPSDTSLPAHYGRAVAYHQQGLTQQALAELEPIKAAMPNNPFVWELAGQISFESGNVADAIEFNQKAVDLAPTLPLLRVGLAQSQIASNDPALTEVALEHLKYANSVDRDNSMGFHQASIAYGRLGDYGNAELATAERYYVLGQLPQAKAHARRAQSELPSGSPGWLRAQDIIQEPMPERS